MRYYIVSNSLFNDSQFAYGEHKKINYNTGNAKYCIECGNPITMLEWLPPYEITVSKKKIGDFIFGSYVGFVVSGMLRDKLQDSDLMGLTNFKKVDLYYKNKRLSEEYYYPEITLITAFIDIGRIKFEEKNLCSVCQKGSSIFREIDGITFISPEEINVDIFFTTAIGQSTIIVSQNFKDFIEKNDFTNLNLIEASNYKWNIFNSMKY